MADDRRPSGSSVNTYVDASGGQRLTAIVVALVGGTLAGLFCVWLGTSILDDWHWLAQTAVFAVIGVVIGLGLLALLARLGARTKS